MELTPKIVCSPATDAKCNLQTLPVTQGHGPAIVHTVASLDAMHGGPSYTVPGLVRALEAWGARVSIVTGGAMVAGSDTSRYPCRMQCARRSGLFTIGTIRKAVEHEATALGAEVVHDHGLWLASNRASARSARRLRLRLVVSPRGMLNPWALAWHPVRKRIAWRLYQQRILAGASLLHATSDLEAEGFRRLGLHRPVAVVPNGVDLPEPAPVRARSEPRIALFLSRLHPVKGLPALLAAWGRLRPPGWVLWVAGAGEAAYEAHLRGMVRVLGLGAVVRFLGSVDRFGRSHVLAQASLFVLPSKSENFGIVVAEALAAGVPVVTTRATPWKVLEEEGCGWWVGIEVGELVHALAEACSATQEQLAAMGAVGRALVARQFAWPAVASRMMAVYRWVVGGGDAPDDVQR